MKQLHNHSPRFYQEECSIRNNYNYHQSNLEYFDQYCKTCRLHLDKCHKYMYPVLQLFFYLLFIFGIYMYKVTGNNNKSQILDECIEETVYKTHK